MDFLPEPLFYLLVNNLKTHNTIILLLFLTYKALRKKSEEFKNEAGVKVVIRPVRTIGRILPFPTDPHNPEEKSCVVYQVPCSDCNFVYIGRHLKPTSSREQVDH